MLEKIQKFREYLDYIERHYKNVQIAWQLINEKCKGKGFRFLKDEYCWNIINEDVINHDLSKLSEHEFCQYRQYFFPTDDEIKNEEAFQKAWEHHKENNVHHWQNWTTKQKNNPCVEAYVVCMLVDWVAMSLEFGGNSQKFYEKKKHTIDLPDSSVKLMYEIFDCIYDEEE